MKIIPRKDPRLPPSWTLLGEAPKSDKNRGLHFLCKKGEKKLQYFGLTAFSLSVQVFLRQGVQVGAVHSTAAVILGWW